MLTHIYIRDFAIIDELDLELQPGMTALTGETGAGKSILLDAIGLVLGDKADSTTVRHGAEKAEIILSIDIQHSPAALAWLKEQELDQDEAICLLRRVISVQGKSKAWINGSPCTLTQLRDLGELMVDIHGQHEHQSLMKREMQRQLLDDFAQHNALLQQVNHTWQEVKTLQDRLTTLTTQQQQHQERLELIRLQLQELDQLALQDNELQTLDEELSILANTGELRAVSEHSFHQLYEAEPSLYSQLTQIQHALAQQSHLDPRLNAPLELVTSVQIQIQEAALSLRDYASDLDTDPERLAWVEQRIADIRQIARKYRWDINELTQQQRRLQQELAQLEGGDYDLETVQTRLKTAHQAYFKVAKQLTQSRIKTAQELSQGVTEAMQQLGMQGGRFTLKIETQETQISPHGCDQIELMVSANPGQPLKPLIKVASGGELSRISLAIQMIAAQRLTLPALIFDEVDTGIGGGIAEVVGQQLRQLGTNRQVLCVTHLPQVASKAHHHYKVTKAKTNANTTTAIEVLNSKARVLELARMIGGIDLTPATKALAQEMLTN
ncbi:DNA repair protein RecN [Thiofilum flexile]|uniref:DNA repair protein RecN n=1 Tax=Thiofilum flexile TaxID=125627 RepID=UPI000368DEB1|nr:DNA repair protein RecN [Thiofilum flexile]